MQQRKLSRLLNRDLYYDANIRLRELTDGRFVYFPFAWREGGKGYFVEAGVAEKARARMWAPVMFFIAPVFLFTSIVLMATDWNLWWVLVTVPASLLLGYGLYTGSRKQLLEQTLNWRAAPYQLTEEQYRLEFAIQQSGWRLWVRLTFWASLIVLLITGGGQLDSSLITLTLYAVVLGLAAQRLYAAWIMLQWRRRAAADGVVIGGLEQLEKAE